MLLQDNTYIKTEGLLWEGVLKSVSKSLQKLQPIFEAVTNSFEALNLLKRQDPDAMGKITIKLYYEKTLFVGTDESTAIFDKIVITDNGIGFDDENFDRVFRYKDIRKGFNNRGSGRLQYLHYFKKTQISSVYKCNDSFFQRDFILSKSPQYVRDNNAIIYYIQTIPSNERVLKTSITFSGILDEKDKNYYESLDIKDIKEILLNRYMMVLCSQRNNLPEIRIEKYYNLALEESEIITVDDIPELDKKDNVDLYYSKISEDLKRVEKDYDRIEQFTISAYKISSEKLKSNSIKVTSKNEVVDNIKIKLDNLKSEDNIEGKRFLFFISSPYIDELDSDVRGDDIMFLSKTEFKRKAKEAGFSDDKILMDDLEDSINEKILSMYDEIKQKAEDKIREIEKLKNMFLLSEETFKELKIGINDSSEKILEKIYTADAKIIAEQDAKIKDIIEALDGLNPTEVNDYQNDFERLVSELVQNIPLQNRTTLSRYIARRKLVLDLFDKILDNKLSTQNDGSRKNDEALLHNLIFKQKSENPNDSDLWMINEDFIYFKGCSEQKLCDVELDGRKLFKNIFNDKQEEYLKSLGENRKIKRPDVLLFPDEGKCIIIEFKTPTENVGFHLGQINRYSSLIRNFTNDYFQINTFYGYLIGEGINNQEVQAFDSDYIPSYQFDYLYRPAKRVIGEYGRPDGSLYTEIISYKTLQKRAMKRNEIFIKKLGL